MHPPYRAVSRVVAVLGLLPLGCAGLRAAPPQPPGLTVGPDGTLLRGGQPYRGIGVNYFDCFARTLGDPDDTSCEEGFAALARLGIPFCRFSACPFWPAQYQLYVEDRAEYWRRMDRVVHAAERQGIGLIPSLFWYSAAVPDLVGEPRDQWGNPESKTHAFMRVYVREMVTRYRRSPALWGWEFGNEYNLAADLPNAAAHRPKIVPKLGTPTTRSARDDLTHEAIAVAFAAFAREVRRHDPHRAIFTGNSAPRPSAWHQWREGTWGQDTPEQFARRLLRDNPDPVDTVTVHVYWDAEKRFGRQATVEEFLRLAMQAAVEAGKPLFVGEFGASRKQGEDEAAVRARFARILGAIERTGVPLAALWVYDFAHQEKTWNITPTNARAWQLEAVAAANRRLHPKR
ncbi:MAG: cellulase family glycosylhydrolase [Planctomycetota bacterium]